MSEESPLHVVTSVAQLRAAVADLRRAGRTIGLVPTMGALHEGHLSLVKASIEEGHATIATIFVNPTQFGPSEDLQSYPRDEAGDLAQLRRVAADGAFLPMVDEMYPPGASTTVSVAGVSDGLCGPFRPGHFAGVATVVCKLLLQALPDVALFGEKDYQQLQVIRRLTRDLDLPIEIVPVATVREEDGLAMSSRNRYLTERERMAAALLPAALKDAVKALQAGEAAAPILENTRAALRAAGFSPIDYVELCDAETLQPLPAARTGSRLFAAAHLGKTRLIDNWPVL
jgi:pantoate--beta-alanine ligase